jgi:hypothetical protein
MEDNWDINPDTGQRWKRGEKRADGYTFSRFGKKKKDGSRTLVFIRDWEEFLAKERKANKKSAKKIATVKASLPKRVNPLTGEEFVFGDLNEEGTHFFDSYGGRNGKKGYRGEQWHPVSYKFNFFIGQILTNAKRRAKKSGLPFNLTREYLINIWPSDGKCPVFGVDLVYLANDGKKRTRQKATASLDKFYPEMGYVEGNVAWISIRANEIKTNASTKQVRSVANWMRRIEGLG